MTSALIWQVSSRSSESGNATSLSALESSSSNESLATFRAKINNPGEYEGLIRDHLDQALNVPHYRNILDMEYFELTVLQRKGLLQDRLFNLMLGERNLSRIMELSLYTNIRREAYDLLEVAILSFSVSIGLVFSVSLRGYKIEKNALDGCPGIEKEGRFQRLEDLTKEGDSPVDSFPWAQVIHRSDETLKAAFSSVSSGTFCQSGKSESVPKEPPKKLSSDGSNMAMNVSVLSGPYLLMTDLHSQLMTLNDLRTMGGQACLRLGCGQTKEGKLQNGAVKAREVDSKQELLIPLFY
nr:hypothetical protein [Tanacetum cinerariifolium]